jgi:CheY-like chemotaxis protein
MPLRGLSVLVVEDDRDHRELAQEMLTALGARVTVAANGEEGVKRLIEDGAVTAGSSR